MYNLLASVRNTPTLLTHDQASIKTQKLNHMENAQGIKKETIDLLLHIDNISD